jgi:hypothetical protein
MNPDSDPKAMELAQLEAQIQGHLCGRLVSLQLSLREEGLVLRGRARTYYAKQLAQHAAMRATKIPIRANEIEVG